MNNINIDVLYIKELAEIINRNEQIVYGFYEDRLDRLLKQNMELIEKNSINYYDYTNNIKSLLEDIDDDLANLYRLLMTEIIPGYEDVALTIKKQFNTDFQESMVGFLDIINK